MIKTLRFAFAAPIALALAACGGTAEESAEIQGEAIAAIPAPAGTEWRDQVTVTEFDGYLVGNPQAPLKLVEYGSLTCPTCARFSIEGSEELMDEYVNSGVVSFELRNQIHGPHDLALATMVRCGAEEAMVPLSDQVWQNLDTVLTPIMQNQAAMEQAVALPPEQRLVAIAEIGGFFDFFASRGLSEDQARTCLADGARYETIANNSTQQSTELGISGTPTFLLNGNQQAGVNTWAQLEPILQRAGAR